jgi:hypothetical protein
MAGVGPAKAGVPPGDGDILKIPVVMDVRAFVIADLQGLVLSDKDRDGGANAGVKITVTTIKGTPQIDSPIHDRTHSCPLSRENCTRGGKA